MTPITHRNREIERLERELAESRKECKRLREAEKFVRSLESCSYSEHSDYVKARELELWQDRAEELVAEWDEALAPKAGDK